MTPLTELLAPLPDAVVQSCRQALEKCPAADSLVLGTDGRPMRTLRHLYFGGYNPDFVAAASATYDLGVQCVVRNVLGDDGPTEFEACIMDDDRETDPDEAASWWPRRREFASWTVQPIAGRACDLFPRARKDRRLPEVPDAPPPLAVIDGRRGEE